MWRTPPPSNRLTLILRIALHLGPALLTIAVGVRTLTAPPASVVDGTELGLRWAWSAILIAGGLSITYGMSRRRIRPQLTGLGLSAGGAGFYSLHLLSLPDGTGQPAAGLIGALALSCLSELYRQLDMARWQRANRDRSRRRHPSRSGGDG